MRSGFHISATDKGLEIEPLQFMMKRGPSDLAEIDGGDFINRGWKWEWELSMCDALMERGMFDLKQGQRQRFTWGIGHRRKKIQGERGNGELRWPIADGLSAWSQGIGSYDEKGLGLKPKRA